MFEKGVFRETLKVFISSAQAEENGFDWIELRKKIADYLNQCPFFNAFAIENSASYMPSTKYFQIQVLKSDIIVQLIKGEVRKGTLRENQIAITNNKKLYMYFIKDDNPDASVETLRSDLIASDNCTFKEVNSVDGIEKRIYQDLINDIILNFQDFSTRIELDSSSKSFKLEAINSGILTAVISSFSSCYSYAFQKMGLSRLYGGECQTLPLAEKLIDWIFDGTI